MKKLLLTLLVVLSLLAVGSALADPRMDCIAALILFDGETSDFAGSAVQVDTGDGTCWLAPADSLKDGYYVVLMMDDGTYAFADGADLLGDSGLARITLSEPMAKAAAVPLSTVRAAEEESFSFIGFDEEGTMLSSAAQRLSAIELNGLTGLSFTGRQEGMLPGAVLSDEQGGVVAVMLTAWSEGQARYAALDADAIRAALGLAAAPAPVGGTECQWVTDAETRVEGGYLAVDLSGCGIPLDGSAWVWDWYIDDANSYYTTRKVEQLTDPVLYFPAVPGRSATLYIAWGTGDMLSDTEVLDRYGSAMAEIHCDFPDATAMERYDYKQDCWLAVTDASASVADTDRLPRADAVTRSLLTDTTKSLRLVVDSSYRVEEDMEDTLLLCLFTPDGQVMVTMATFLYGVDFMDEDVWNYDMTAMFRDALEFCGDPLPGGTYTMAYYIGDSLAGSFSFDLPSDTVEDEGSSL